MTIVVHDSGRTGGTLTNGSGRCRRFWLPDMGAAPYDTDVTISSSEFLRGSASHWSEFRSLLAGEVGVPVV